MYRPYGCTGLLTPQRGHRSRLAPGEKPNGRRMATVACDFDASPPLRLPAPAAPRRPHGVSYSPGGRRTRRQVRRGPTATRKRTHCMPRSPTREGHCRCLRPGGRPTRPPSKLEHPGRRHPPPSGLESVRGVNRQAARRRPRQCRRFGAQTKAASVSRYVSCDPLGSGGHAKQTHACPHELLTSGPLLGKPRALEGRLDADLGERLGAACPCPPEFTAIPHWSRKIRCTCNAAALDSIGTTCGSAVLQDSDGSWADGELAELHCCKGPALTGL